MGKFLLYCLYDPETGELRYVGQTVRNLKVRLQGHVGQARDDGKNNKRNHHSNWILSLLKKDLRPEIKLLQKLNNQEDLDAAEIYWIKYFREIGCNINNAVDGGQGGKNPSLHTRKLISEALKGRIVS